MGLLDALEAQASGTAYAEAALVRRVAREAREDRGRLLAAGALGLLVVWALISVIMVAARVGMYRADANGVPLA